MKKLKKNQFFEKTFVQNISRIFQNKHPIVVTPKGRVWLVLFRLHPIAPTINMGNWALITPIIVNKFLSNHHPLLLEAIGANKFGPLPLYAKFKLAWDFFSFICGGLCSPFCIVYKEGNKSIS